MSSKSNKAQRLSIFYFCAPFASRILASEEQLYLCPICGKKFPKESAENGELTLEDIPPRTMGGTGLLLTCKTCNSLAGYKIDFFIKNQQDLQNFYQLFSRNNIAYNKQITSNLLIGDWNFPVSISRKDDHTEIKIIKKANNPNQVNNLHEHLILSTTNKDLDGSEFKITKTIKFDLRLYKLALLKSGFLLLTAMLGYTYAFNERLSIIHEQISKPEINLLGSDFWIEQNKNQPFPKRRIILVSSPLPLFLVTYDNYAVILPSLSSPENLYTTMKKEWKQGVINFTGKEYEWPKKALMILDIQNQIKSNPASTR